MGLLLFVIFMPAQIALSWLQEDVRKNVKLLGCRHCCLLTKAKISNMISLGQIYRGKSARKLIATTKINLKPNLRNIRSNCSCNAPQTRPQGLVAKVLGAHQLYLSPTEYPKKVLQYCRKYDFQGFRSLVFLQYHMMLSDPAEIQVSPPPRPSSTSSLRLACRTSCRAHRCCTRSTCTPF